MAWTGREWGFGRAFLRQPPSDPGGHITAFPNQTRSKTATQNVTDKDAMPENAPEQPHPSGTSESSESADNASDKHAHIVVVGNQKGGSGKSTTTMHVIASLLSTGASVASIDLDARQGTLTRYIENRRKYAERRGINLVMPTHRPIEPSSVASIDVARAHDAHSVEKAVQDLAPRHDYIVIDTPGTDNFLSRVGHSYSDTLITPLNDSFIDLDVLAMIDPETYAMTRPSKYAEMVFQVKMQKARREKSNRTFDWVVMRNRTGQLESRNQRSMEEALTKLSSRIGFRQVPGFSERVIFRELFLDGLTLLDLKTPGTDIRMNMSHLSARQEVRDLMAAIGLDQETQ
jgi:chromosome partitioning protein